MSSTLFSSTPCTTTAAMPAVSPDPVQADFTTALSHGAWAMLSQFGVLKASGNDATSFLHGQFTNDMHHLDSTHAHLSGYCFPQGRLLASFLAWRTGDAIQLLLPKDVQNAVQKRLAMFVLRAKVTLADANEALMAVGFAGNMREALASLVGTPLPGDERADVQTDTQVQGQPGVYAQIDTTLGSLIRLPDAACHPRYLLVGPKAAISAHLASCNATMTNVSPTLWDWLAIRAGEPGIVQATQAQFVPQSVNFDVLGGVNFHKGCYPGQEVVARTQYRGTIKRRMMLAHAACLPDVAHAGVELFHSVDPGQPCGMIVNAATAPGGGVDLLAELKLDAIQAGSVHVGAADGPVLQMLRLPYEVEVPDEK